MYGPYNFGGDDTIGRALCAKAKKPISTTLTDELGLNSVKVGAVCVYHDMIETAVSKLTISGIPVTAVQQVFLQGYHHYLSA